jgi:hypothetical protein
VNGREADDRLFQEYLAGLDVMRRLPDKQRADEEAAERKVRSGLDAAMLAERVVKDAVRTAESALRDAAQRTAKLAARSGADTAGVGPDVTQALPERLADLDRVLRPLLADLRSAESSWDWVERTRRAGHQAVDPPPSRPSPIPVPVIASNVDTPSNSARTRQFIAFFGISALVILLVIIFSF